MSVASPESTTTKKIGLVVKWITADSSVQFSKQHTTTSKAPADRWETFAFETLFFFNSTFIFPNVSFAVRQNQSSLDRSYKKIEQIKPFLFPVPKKKKYCSSREEDCEVSFHSLPSSFQGGDATRHRNTASRYPIHNIFTGAEGTLFLSVYLLVALDNPQSKNE